MSVSVRGTHSQGDAFWGTLLQAFWTDSSNDQDREQVRLDAQFLMSLAGKMLVHNACAYHRRTLQPCQTYPLKLLQLGHSHAKVWQSIVQELLDPGPAPLPAVAVKFREAFNSDLLEAAKTGELPSNISFFVKELKQKWYADVRVSKLILCVCFSQ